MTNQYIRWGSSPRGVQTLVLAAKVRALLDGRYQCQLRGPAPGLSAQPAAPRPAQLRGPGRGDRARRGPAQGARRRAREGRGEGARRQGRLIRRAGSSGSRPPCTTSTIRRRPPWPGTRPSPSAWSSRRATSSAWSCSARCCSPRRPLAWRSEPTVAIVTAVGGSLVILESWFTALGFLHRQPFARPAGAVDDLPGGPGPLARRAGDRRDADHGVVPGLGLAGMTRGGARDGDHAEDGHDRRADADHPSRSALGGLQGAPRRDGE